MVRAEAVSFGRTAVSTVCFSIARCLLRTGEELSERRERGKRRETVPAPLLKPFLLVPLYRISLRSL